MMPNLVLSSLFRIFSGVDGAGRRINDTVARGGGAHFVLGGRLVFEIGVVVDRSGGTVASRRHVVRRRTPSDTTDRGSVKSLSFEFPQSVAFDGEPSKNKKAGHDHTETDNESGEGTWILGPICGRFC